MKSLSAVIITRNEEHNIGRCIDSLWHVADEVIVLDSYSSDNTVAIARQKGAIVKQENFPDTSNKKIKPCNWLPMTMFSALMQMKYLSTKIS